MKRVIMAFLTVAIVALAPQVWAAQQQTQAPLKIGVLAPMTGAFAAGGWLATEGVKLAFESVNNEINGRPIQLFIEDTGTNPTMAVQKARRLVEREKVQLIIGPLSGGEGMAIKDYAARVPNVTIIVAGAASEDITMRGTHPNVFRTSYTGAQVMFPFGEYAFKEMGIKKLAVFSPGYAFPFSQVGGFLSTFIPAGGEVVARIWTTLGTTDFSSHIAQIPKDVDGVLVTLGGSDAINFMRQLREYGLRDQVKILGGSIFVDPVVLSQSGADLVGVMAGSHYAQDLPYKEFKEFDTAFTERSGMPSSLWAADYFIATQVAIAGLQAVKGNLENQDAFRAALSKVKMDTPRGPFSFDSFRNVVLTAYITQVTKVGDQYRNVVLHSFPNSDQFGPFDPDWYQAQPASDQTNPTAENLKKAKRRQK
jgi:branched-chain amino acid transport system substrate-binding protein